LISLFSRFTLLLTLTWVCLGALSCDLDLTTSDVDDLEASRAEDAHPDKLRALPRRRTEVPPGFVPQGHNRIDARIGMEKSGEAASSTAFENTTVRLPGIQVFFVEENAFLRQGDSAYYYVRISLSLPLRNLVHI